MLRRIILVFLLLSSAAVAQTPPAQPAPPDIALLNRALNVLQAQRNEALDKAAIMEAKVGGLADDLAKANARIKELETKPSPDK